MSACRPQLDRNLRVKVVPMRSRVLILINVTLLMEGPFWHHHRKKTKDLSSECTTAAFPSYYLSRTIRSLGASIIEKFKSYRERHAVIYRFPD